jgi:redox-sensitive bicupin YhaK (pirin superfamily)
MLDGFNEDTLSELRVKAGMDGARIVLYAAMPLGEPIVSHGSFITDREEEVQPLYHQFRSGQMQYIADADDGQSNLLIR